MTDYPFHVRLPMLNRDQDSYISLPIRLLSPNSFRTFRLPSGGSINAFELILFRHNSLHSRLPGGVCHDFVSFASFVLGRSFGCGQHSWMQFKQWRRPAARTANCNSSDITCYRNVYLRSVGNHYRCHRRRHDLLHHRRNRAKHFVFGLQQSIHG